MTHRDGLTSKPAMRAVESDIGPEASAVAHLRHHQDCGKGDSIVDGGPQIGVNWHSFFGVRAILQRGDGVCCMFHTQIHHYHISELFKSRQRRNAANLTNCDYMC